MGILYLESKVGTSTRRWVLDRRPLLLGRDRACDIVVEDASVSRVHLRIRFDGEEIHLEDAESSNGLWVEGKRVPMASVRIGQWFSTGEILFSIREGVSLASAQVAGATSPGEGASSDRAAEERSSERQGVRAQQSRDGGAQPGTQGEGREAIGRRIDQNQVRLRDLLIQVISRLDSPDGALGALLSSVVALSHGRGGAVLARSPGGWVCIASDGALPAGDPESWSGVDDSSRSPSALSMDESGWTSAQSIESDPASADVSAAPSRVVPRRVLLGQEWAYEHPVQIGGLEVARVLIYPARAPAPEQAQATPVGIDVLVEEVRRVLARSEVSRAAPDLPATEIDRSPVGFLCVSDAGRRVLSEIDRLAPTDLPVLLHGESGTGKELLARRLHRLSKRAPGTFVALNCSTFPENLVEAELFGIHRGVATGVSERPGRFQQASGGTLLLDEIADLPLTIQPKILRALEAGEVQPVGAPRPVPVSVRLVAATHVDLHQGVREGRFRQDLLFRLLGAEVHVPTLRERPEDILPMARLFAREAAAESGRRFLGIELEAARILLGYRWPGNVRELRHVIARAVALADGPILHEGLLPANLLGESDLVLGEAMLGLLQEWNAASDAFARLYFTRLLARCDGNVSDAARKAGLSRSTLYAKLQELGIKKPGDLGT